MLSKNRLEAFSDGVIAIIITIMAFDLKLQELPAAFSDADVWRVLAGVVPKFLSYLLSFIVLAIMWINHHALLDKLEQSSPQLVWYNMFLLFSMSLIPLPTNFMAAHPFLYQSVMFYALVMFFNVFAFFLLRRYIEIKAKLLVYNSIAHRSNLFSMLLYAAAIPLALLSVYLSFIIFVIIPVWYFLPKGGISNQAK